MVSAVKSKSYHLQNGESTLVWLALLNDFRTFDWAEEYKYPTVVLDQMKGLLAKYENL